MAISGRDQGMLDWTPYKTDGGWSQSTENMAQACVTGKRAANGREAWRAAKEAEWAVREHREPGRGVSVQEALWGALPVCVCVCVCVCLLILVGFDSATPETVTCQAPWSTGTLQEGILEWVAMPSSRGSSQPRD